MFGVAVHMEEPPHRHPSLLLDFVIVAFGVGLVILYSRFSFEAGHPASKGAGAILGGLYLIYLGVLFLLSYFFSGACYVFSFFTYICEACSHPSGRRMAWFYFILNLLIGLSLLLVGLGVL